MAGYLSLPSEYRDFIDARGGPGLTGMDDRLDFMIVELWALLNKASGAGGGASGIGNVPYIRTKREIVPAPGTASRLPEIKIPEGMTVAIRGLRTNKGLVYLSGSKDQAEGHTMVTTLGAGDAVELHLTTLWNLWVDADVANDGIEWLVEQEATD
jgi:hypothetical protein